MFYKKLFLIVIIGLSIISLIYFSADKNKLIIKYATNNNKQFYWTIEDGSSIYYIKPITNNFIQNINSDKYFKNLLAQQQFTNYKFIENKFSFNNISISEDLPENSFLISHKFSFDMNIDSKGQVTLNIYYPENKIGGYTFKLSKKDFDLMINILSQISLNDFVSNFSQNTKTNQVIIFNEKYILNDPKEINSKIKNSSIVMFSNYITMKYLENLKPTNTKYKIESSKYITTKPIDELIK